MRYLMTAIAIVLSVSAANAEEPQRHDQQQQHGQYGPVPYPLEEGYPYCVTSIVRPEHRERYGLASRFPAPLTYSAANALNFGVEEGILELKHCNEEPS